MTFTSDLIRAALTLTVIFSASLAHASGSAAPEKTQAPAAPTPPPAPAPPPAPPNFDAYVADANDIKLFPAENPERAIDLQLLHELDATAIRLNIHSTVVYWGVLNSAVYHPASDEFLQEQDNPRAKRAVIQDLKKNLANFINTGAIEAIGTYLSDPKNKPLFGEGWRADPLLQQLTLELLAQWEGEQVTFMNATASMNKLPEPVLQAYNAKCTREVRTLELLYNMTGDKLPVGIEVENGLQLLYQIYHGSLLQSSGCPAQVLNSRKFSVEDEKLPFGLPNIRSRKFVVNDYSSYYSNEVGPLTQDQIYHLKGLKPGIDGKWMSAPGIENGDGKHGHIEWNPAGFMNYRNTYHWAWESDDVDVGYMIDRHVVDGSDQLLQHWH